MKSVNYSFFNFRHKFDRKFGKNILYISVLKSALSGRLSARLSGSGIETLRLKLNRVIKRFGRLSGSKSALAGFWPINRLSWTHDCICKESEESAIEYAGVDVEAGDQVRGRGGRGGGEREGLKFGFDEDGGRRERWGGERESERQGRRRREMREYLYFQDWLFELQLRWERRVFLCLARIFELLLLFINFCYKDVQC